MAYQTNCGIGDPTPEGFVFSPLSYAGECQCGQGECIGEYGQFTPIQPLEEREKGCSCCGNHLTGFEKPSGLCDHCTNPPAPFTKQDEERMRKFAAIELAHELEGIQCPNCGQDCHSHVCEYCEG